MLYSHSYQEKEFDFFASFVRNVLLGKEQYRPIVQPVIVDAKSLVNNKKDYFEIDRKAYDLIVFLAEKAPDFFKDLNTEHVTNSEYQYILNLLTTHPEPIIA